VYFGKGAKHGTPSAYRINGTAGNGTNIAGGKVTIAGGKSTGSATPAVVALAASLAGSRVLSVTVNRKKEGRQGNTNQKRSDILSLKRFII